MSTPDLMEQSGSLWVREKETGDLWVCSTACLTLLTVVNSDAEILKHGLKDSVAGKEHRSFFAGLKILIQCLLGEKGKFSLNHMQKQPILEGKKKRRGYQKTVKLWKMCFLRCLMCLVALLSKKIFIWSHSGKAQKKTLFECWTSG